LTDIARAVIAPETFLSEIVADFIQSDRDTVAISTDNKESGVSQEYSVSLTIASSGGIEVLTLRMPDCRAIVMEFR
jgi:hypothetical protein